MTTAMMFKNAVAGGGGGGGLDLSDLTGYKFDFQSHLKTYSDSARTTPVSAHGSTVDGWGNNNVAVNVHCLKRGGTSSPTVDTTNTLNGFRTLAFSGSAFDLASRFTGSETGGTLIMVLKTANNTSGKGMQQLGGGGDGVWYPVNTNELYDNTFSNSRPFIGTHVLSINTWRAYIVVNNSSGKKVWLDATAQYSGNPGYVNYTSTAVIGQSGNSAFFSGWIAAAFIFTSKLSDADVATAWGRIQTFYGL